MGGDTSLRRLITPTDTEVQRLGKLTESVAELLPPPVRRQVLPTLSDTGADALAKWQRAVSERLAPSGTSSTPGLTSVNPGDINLADGQLIQGSPSGRAASISPSTLSLSLFGAPTADLSLASKKITSLATPTVASDAATKGYVDTVAMAAGAVTSVFGRAGGVTADPADYAAWYLRYDGAQSLSGAQQTQVRTNLGIAYPVTSVFGRAGGVGAVAADYSGFYLRHDANQGLNATQQQQGRVNLALADSATIASSNFAPANIFSTKSTSDLAEGSNLYYTNLRVDAYITTIRGVVSGICDLDATIKVPTARIPWATQAFATHSDFTLAATDAGQVVVRNATDTGWTNRYLVEADIPSLPATRITSGVLAPDRLASGTALQVLRRNVTNSALEFATISVGGGDMLASNNLAELPSPATARFNLGLYWVDNTSDLSKPISTATQAALNLKAPLASPAFTGTVTGITSAMVGLGNVPNVDATNASNISSGLLAPNRLASGTALQVLRRDASNTGLEFATIAVGAGDMIAANNLSDVPNKPQARINLGLVTVAASGLFTDLTSRPTTLAGYGITDAQPLIATGTANQFWTYNKTWAQVDWSQLSGRPTIPAAQVNSDWNASAGVAVILNKPTLGNAAYANIGAAAGQVAAGDHVHDASKITTGTFTTTLIPNLDAAKITSGTFATTQIPNLDASKVTTGLFAATRLVTNNAVGYLRNDGLGNLAWGSPSLPSHDLGQHTGVNSPQMGETFFFNGTSWQNGFLSYSYLTNKINSTTEVPEGSRLYYTDVRVDNRISSYHRGMPNGLCELDSGAKVPVARMSSQLLGDHSDTSLSNHDVGTFIVRNATDTAWSTRYLAATDIPSLDASKIATGLFAATRLVATNAAGVLRNNGSGTLSWDASIPPFSVTSPSDWHILRYIGPPYSVWVNSPIWDYLAAYPLDLMAAPTSTTDTTRNSNTTRHGLLPKLSGNSSEYLNGAGGWSTPGGGSGMSVIVSIDEPYRSTNDNFRWKNLTFSNGSLTSITECSSTVVPIDENGGTLSNYYKGYTG